MLLLEHVLFLVLIYQLVDLGLEFLELCFHCDGAARWLTHVHAISISNFMVRGMSTVTSALTCSASDPPFDLAAVEFQVASQAPSFQPFQV